MIDCVSYLNYIFDPVADIRNNFSLAPKKSNDNW